MLRAAAASSRAADEFWERQLSLKVEQLAVLQQQLDAANRSINEAAVKQDNQAVQGGMGRGGA